MSLYSAHPICYIFIRNSARHAPLVLTSQIDLRMTPLYKNHFSELLLIRLIYNTWGLAPHLPIQIAPLRCTITINLTLKIVLQVHDGDKFASQRLLFCPRMHQSLPDMSAKGYLKWRVGAAGVVAANASLIRTRHGCRISNLRSGARAKMRAAWPSSPRPWPQNLLRSFYE